MKIRPPFLRRALAALLLISLAPVVRAQTFVAVGYGTGIGVSADGASWAKATVPGFGGNVFEESLTDAAWGNGRFVAVGGDFAKGRISISADGRVWENLPPQPERVWCVAFGNGRFVALRGRHFISSTDGKTWQDGAELPAEKQPQPLRIAFGNGVFTVIGTHAWSGADYLTNGFRAVTRDGAMLEHFATGQPHARDVIFAAGQFVAVGRRELCEVSADGRAWERRSFNRHGNDFRQVIWTGERFIAEGGSTPFASVDGKAWTPLSYEMEPIRCCPRWLWSDGKTTIASAWESLFTSSDTRTWRDVGGLGAAVPKDPSTAKGTTFMRVVRAIGTSHSSVRPSENLTPVRYQARP